MSERGFRVKSDSNKIGWEQSDFPILCETCLGENPYVRMLKMPAGMACKICERPFTVFKWKPGPRARFKKTEVCQMCARLKNVCQTCVLDLTYGLPVQVRDSFLAKAAAHGINALSVPESRIGQAYQAQQHATMLANGDATGAGHSEAIHQGLLRLVRRQPKYSRNLPHLCSFYARGECNRGDECPYRHEMPRAKDDPLRKQNIVDRFYGRHDPVAERMLARTQGQAKYADPPSPQARTLWLAPVDASVSSNDIKNKFYAYGEVQNIKLIPAKTCAFVEFASQAQAVQACKALFSSLEFNGVKVRVQWAHARKPRGPRGSSAAGAGAGAGTGPRAAPGGVSAGSAAAASSAAPGAAGATPAPGSAAAAASASAPATATAGSVPPPPPRPQGTFQLPASFLKSMPAPPGVSGAGAVIPPPPPKGKKGAKKAAYTGFIPPPPPRKGAGPVRRQKSTVARTKAHPYASMDPRAMGSRVRMT